MNTCINQIQNGMNNINNASDGVVATNAFITVNGYYQCTRTGNYWIEVVGGGGGGW